MFKLKHHFLDTNVILSIPLENKNYRDCIKYFKLDYERHISNHVKVEIFQVIARLRLISLNIFNHIKDYILSKNISLIKIDSHIHNIKSSYLHKYKDLDYVFGIEKDRFLDIVNEVFINYHDEIKDTLMHNDVNLSLLSSKLKKLFDKYDNIINKCLSNFDISSFVNNQNIVDKLIKIGIHESDSIIVDDCYNKALEINEKFVFITYDKKILESSEDAFKLLNSKVYFSKPVSFLNN